MIHCRCCGYPRDSHPVVLSCWSFSDDAPKVDMHTSQPKILAAIDLADFIRRYGISGADSWKYMEFRGLFTAYHEACVAEEASK